MKKWAKYLLFYLGLFGLPSLLLWTNFAQNNRSLDSLAKDWGETVLKDLPEKAVICVYSDLDTFVLSYLIHVEQFRSDITLISYNVDAVTAKPYQILEWPWLDAKGREAIRADQITYLLQKEKRPIYTPLLPNFAKEMIFKSDGFYFVLHPQEKNKKSNFKNRVAEAENFFKTELAAPSIKMPLGWFPFLKEWASVYIGAHYLELVHDHLKKRESKKVMEIITKILPFAESSPRLVYAIAEVFLLAGPENYDRATALMKKSLELSRNLWLIENPDVWYRLGWIMLQQQHWTGALYYTEQALSRDTKMAKAYGQLGFIYHALKKNSLASKNLAKALVLDPELSEVRLLLDKINALQSSQP